VVGLEEEKQEAQPSQLTDSESDLIEHSSVEVARQLEELGCCQV